MAKSEASRIAAICNAEKCNWRVFISVEVPLNKWMVKVCHNEHNHEKTSRVSMLKQGVIAGLFREEIRRNINLPAAQIKDTIKERYNIVVPMSKCYRGRQIALDTILQAQSIQFSKLWDYQAELTRKHPDITTEFSTQPGGQMFDCFYICFKEFARSWKNNCRPVIGLDGCFLKWELCGDVLAAVGRDADNRMYPIAWAVVRGENKDTWGWFIRRIKADLDLGVGDGLTIISDKQKGLVLAVGAELPNAEHRMCARHIYANWRKTFSRAFFSIESRCHDVHNNLSEAFNRTIKIARSKPVLSLLEDIRRQAMRRISRRQLKAAKVNTILTPITMGILEKARVDNKYCSTLRSSSTEYEVQEFDNSYTVLTSSHQCACRRWDLIGIPCHHAICVLDDNQESPVNYVSPYYSTSLMQATYAHNIKPMNGEKLWPKVHKPPILIPEFRKPRGRPPTRDRRKEPFEDLQNKGKVTRHGRTMHCSNCGEAGHIKSGCKNEKVVVEGPKNRRGRPRKNPADVVPKRPTKPRKKRKTDEAVSSSQPVQQVEAIDSYPAASTAPEPSVAAKPKKTRVKKPSREHSKRYLNIDESFH
ncbi:uncharacterized protein LOC112089101 [Eutrema salsugineum]|uniref:uncharacterized protein LOC112089101 n=1 Tax=Eutrema salsugineum TaxID=72664 RepID=UPI000CECFA18|nr:uncharacterized protein LOC112089101 [Eutrema salsugineum]